MPVQPSSGKDELRPLPAGLLSRYPWLTFLLPMVVYLLVGTLEPTSADKTPEPPGRFAVAYENYPVVYTVKILLTLVAMAVVLPGYRTFRLRVRPIALAVGVVGAALWIGLCLLRLELRLLTPLGLDGLLGLGARSAYNPFEQIADPVWAWAFLAVRFFGLVVVVAVIEEFFLRGFVMRFIATDERWWQLPLDQMTAAALVAGTVVPMLMHPAELLAALVWFSLVTWLMLRTANIWDCVTAHAVTNLLLGVYVVTSGDWRLW